MDKKLEEAIKKSLSNKERGTCVISAEILETVLNHIKNSISKEVIEKNMELYKQLELGSFNKDSIQADEYRAIENIEFTV